MSEKEMYDLCNDMIMETLQEVMKNMFDTTERMEQSGLPPSMGFELIRSVGFAVLGSSLSFFPGDANMRKAADALHDDFKVYLDKSVEANKGMSNATKSSLILQ